MNFDTIVIGAGQAGPPIVARMNREGLKTALIERNRLGGTCVNYGCIPTKSGVASARVAHMARRAKDFGVHHEGHGGFTHTSYNDHEILDMVYAKATYTVLRGAVHNHPTVAELFPTVLESLKSLEEHQQNKKENDR